MKAGPEGQMKTYRDYCRPACRLERTQKSPGDKVLDRVDRAARMVEGSSKVVRIGGRRG